MKNRIDRMIFDATTALTELEPADGPCKSPAAPAELPKNVRRIRTPHAIRAAAAAAALLLISGGILYSRRAASAPELSPVLPAGTAPLSADTVPRPDTRDRSRLIRSARDIRVEARWLPEGYAVTEQLIREDERSLELVAKNEAEETIRVSVTLADPDAADAPGEPVGGEPATVNGHAAVVTAADGAASVEWYDPEREIIGSAQSADVDGETLLQVAENLDIQTEEPASAEPYADEPFVPEESNFPEFETLQENDEWSTFLTAPRDWFVIRWLSDTGDALNRKYWRDSRSLETEAELPEDDSGEYQQWLTENAPAIAEIPFDYDRNESDENPVADAWEYYLATGESLTPDTFEGMVTPEGLLWLWAEEKEYYEQYGVVPSTYYEREPLATPSGEPVPETPAPPEGISFLGPGAQQDDPQLTPYPVEDPSYLVDAPSSAEEIPVPVEETIPPEEETPIAEEAPSPTAPAGLDGKSVEDLYAVSGSPDSTAYAPSSIVIDAEDGTLYYDGFTAHTVRYEDGSEYIVAID